MKDGIMGRALRIEYEDSLYHILPWGNEKKDIFYDNQDHLLFLKTFGEMSERFEINVFTHMLMGNHPRPLKHEVFYVFGHIENLAWRP